LLLGLHAVVLLLDEVGEEVEYLLDISQVGLTNLIELRIDLVDVVLELLDLGVNQLTLFTGALDEELSVGAPIELLDTRCDLVLEVL
jgi:hypothetical protein